MPRVSEVSAVISFDWPWRNAAAQLIRACFQGVEPCNCLLDDEQRPEIRLLQLAVPRDPDEPLEPLPPPPAEGDTGEWEGVDSCGSKRLRRFWHERILDGLALPAETRDEVLENALAAVRNAGGRLIITSVLRELELLMTSVPDLSSKRRVESISVVLGHGDCALQLTICFSSSGHYFEPGKEEIRLDFDFRHAADDAGAKLLELLDWKPDRGGNFTSTVLGAKVNCKVVQDAPP